MPPSARGFVAGTVFATVTMLVGTPASSAAPPRVVGAAASAGAPTDERIAQVQKVLDARVAAVVARDEAAWMATVDPRAGTAFRTLQQRQIQGWLALPIIGFGLQARTRDTGDLGTGLDARHGAPVFLPETRLRYRLQGYDDRDVVESQMLTFVRRGTNWFVAADDDLDDLAIYTSRNLWDLGPVATIGTEHFLVIHHPEHADRANDLGRLAEQALVALQARWQRVWSERLPVVLPGSVAELETLLHATLDVGKFVAFVTYESVWDDDYQASAPRLYLQDRNLAGYSEDRQVEILVHELVHAASAPLAGPYIPSWVHEGVADWIAAGKSTTERRPRGSDGRIPRDYELSTGSGSSISLAYNESRSAMSFLARKRGPDAPVAFFERLGADRLAPGSVDHHLDAALAPVAGFDLARLERDWGRR
ncbi:MAG TPA: hypothetical protein VMY34_02460 [Acidimicrobiales bacterium]|nr:hypothetical protein [Acidimicrobiales bacterium]